MTSIHLVDANVIIRWLIEDDKQKSQAFVSLIKQAERHNRTLFVSDLSIAEIVWVLDSVYKIPLEEVAEAIRKILGDQRLTFENKGRLMTAITLWENHKVDFIDAYQAALAQEKNMETIMSYDTHFDRIPGIKRSEP